MQVEILNKSVNPNPRYEHKGDAGLDLRADFSKITPKEPIKAFGNAQFVFTSEQNPSPYLVLDPGSRALIPTNIHIAIPYGYYAEIKPRSGLAAKQGVMACIGVLDSNYRGNIMVNLFNLGDKPVVIEHTERIAQMVVLKHEEVEWIDVKELAETERGSNGIGSSGRM